MPGKAAKVIITERQQEILQRGFGNLNSLDKEAVESS